MAAKLKDGVFLGDYEAAQDLEFIVANKITRIINCAGREVANSWERSGIKYLTYYWPDSGNCIVFDESNTVLDEIYSYVEEACDAGESVLIHSTDGVSRASFCASVYFMLKYRWTLNKTFAYLVSKRPDLQPKPGFMRQLQALDASLQKVARASARGPNDPAVRRCSEWDPALVTQDPAIGYDDDESMLTHTYLNSKAVSEELVMAAQSSTPLPRQAHGGGKHSGRRRGITWIDDGKRAATAHADVPLSPLSKKPTVERPPSASYNSLALGPGWVDPTGAAQAQGGPRSGGPLLVPVVGGHVSAAGAALPPPHAPVRSILKGSAAWAEERRAGGRPRPGGGAGVESGDSQGSEGLSGRGQVMSARGGGEESSRPPSSASESQRQPYQPATNAPSQWSSTSAGMAASMGGTAAGGGMRGTGAGAMPAQGGAGLGMTNGPVRAVHTAVKPMDLNSTYGNLGGRGSSAVLAESLAALAGGNMSRTLGPQGGQQAGSRPITDLNATAGHAHNLASSVANALSSSSGSALNGSGGSGIHLGQPPGRGASNRVRGYSPGPGRLKGSTGPSGGPAQGGRSSATSLDGDDSPVVGPGASTGGQRGAPSAFASVGTAASSAGRPGSGRQQASLSQTNQVGSNNSLLMPQMRVQSSGLVNYVSQSSLGASGGGGGMGMQLGMAGGYGAPSPTSAGMNLGSSFGYGQGGGSYSLLAPSAYGASSPAASGGGAGARPASGQLSSASQSANGRPGSGSRQSYGQAPAPSSSSSTPVRPGSGRSLQASTPTAGAAPSPYSNQQSVGHSTVQLGASAARSGATPARPQQGVQQQFMSAPSVGASGAPVNSYGGAPQQVTQGGGMQLGGKGGLVVGSNAGLGSTTRPSGNLGQSSYLSSSQANLGSSYGRPGSSGGMSMAIGAGAPPSFPQSYGLGSMGSRPSPAASSIPGSLYGAAHVTYSSSPAAAIASSTRPGSQQGTPVRPAMGGSNNNSALWSASGRR